MILYTSYFYQVRNFTPRMIPLSTAVFDPKWYYNGSQGEVFFDKRGVLNGTRYEPFVPGSHLEGMCHGRDGCPHSPNECTFLKAYSEQLEHLDIDNILRDLQRFSDAIKSEMKMEKEPILVLLFHEAPDNPCSERWAVQNWFANHYYPLEELMYPIALEDCYQL